MISQGLSVLRRGSGLIALLVMALQPGLDVTKNTATVSFPSSIDFHLEATSDAAIESVEIEVSTSGLSCGSGATRAAPDQFTGGKSITADWAWELRQTGALPPGTVVTWKWIAHTEDGATIETPEQQVTVDDTNHTWQNLDTPELRLQWYGGDQDFAAAIQSAAIEGIANLKDTLGVVDDGQVRVYLYATTDDMKDATLYAPSWSGGLAFSTQNTILLAAGPGDEEWAIRAIKHELTHIIVGRHTFSCVNSTPTWFEEGLAMNFEGQPEKGYTDLLQQSIDDDTLLSVRELGTAISGDPRLASLSYAQSDSLVRFLIEEYGTDKLLQLLDEWKAGTSQDKALTAVYGFDRDGLEVAWRESVDAQPMEPAPVETGAEPTMFPTYLPLEGAPLAATEIIPTPAYLNPVPDAAEGDAGSVDQPAQDDGQTGLIIGLSCAAIGVVVVLIVVIVFIAWLSQRKPPARPDSPAGIN